jgi:RNA 3'-terminal phosphate cyclase (ATP)
VRQGLIEIDGSRGEGGGQILRTALSLAMISQQPVRIRNIRAKRSKPGLLAQHLACVLAAEHISGAAVDGAKKGSTMVEIVAGKLRGGNYRMEVGTAGSAGLVLQTLLVPLMTAAGPSRVVIEGGTHNRQAPPFDFLARAYLPALRRMGARVELTIDRHGFYPAGGGRIVCTIQPAPLVAIAIDELSPVRRRSARALVARLPRSVGERELAVIRKDLGWREDECEVVEVESPGPGNAVILEVERDGVSEVVTGFGEKGVAAERVAEGAVRELGRYLGAQVPVGEHLADQLLLPMAIARGGRFRTAALSSHATTNLETIAKFVDLPVAVKPAPGGVLVELGD